VNTVTTMLAKTNWQQVMSLVQKTAYTLFSHINSRELIALNYCRPNPPNMAKIYQL